MGWNSSTKVMTAPISLDDAGDIQKATNCESGDLGTCITTGTINKWAKHKPQCSAALGEMTAAQRASGNYGFDLSDGDGTTTVYSNTLSGALTLALASSRGGDHSGAGDWPYLRPRGGSYDEYFRFFDFLNPANHSSSGYNANALEMFSYTVPAAPTNNHTTQYLTNFDVTRTSGAELYLSDFTKSGVSLGNLYYGIVYRRSGSASTYLAKSSTTVNGLSSGSTAHIEVTFPEPASYQGCYVVTSASNTGDGTGDTIYLPNSTFTFTYTKIPYTVYYSISWPSVTPTMTYNSTNDTYDINLDILGYQFASNTSMSSNPETSGQNIDLQLAVLYNGIDIWNGTSTVSSVLTLPSTRTAGSTNLSTIVSADAENFLHNVSAGSSVTIRIQLIANGNNSQGQSATLSLVSGSGLDTTVTVPTR